MDEKETIHTGTDYQNHQRIGDRHEEPRYITEGAYHGTRSHFDHEKKPKNANSVIAAGRSQFVGR